MFKSAKCIFIRSGISLLLALFVDQPEALAGEPKFYKVNISFDKVSVRIIGENTMDLRDPNGPQLPPQFSKTKITGFFMTDGTIGPIGMKNILDYELNFNSTVEKKFNIHYSSRSVGKCDPNNGCILRAAKGTEVYFDDGGAMFLEARADGKLYLRRAGVYFAMVYTNAEQPVSSQYRFRLDTAYGQDSLFAEARINSANPYIAESYQSERPAAPIGTLMQVDR